MTWRPYAEHNSVARRPRFGAIGGPVCALAPDPAAPLRADSPTFVGASRRVGHDVAALPHAERTAWRAARARLGARARDCRGRRAATSGRATDARSPP